MEGFEHAEHLSMEEVMQVERLELEDIGIRDAVNPIEPVLPMEMTDIVPDMVRAVVCGDPYFWGEKLDYQQGYDNPYGAFGTCGPTSIANLCTMAGMEITEPEVVDYAIQNGFSEPPRPGEMGGATTIGGELRILEHYGMSAHCELNTQADCERIAQLIESGRGVICGLNSGILQERDWKIYNQMGEIQANHAVCMTGTVRNPDTGELSGFYLCDSSSQRPDGAMIYVPLEKMRQCYENTTDGFVIATDAPIR